jgi:Tol biopolymer transport system component
MGETVATDGQRIVFISDRDGQHEIYVMDPSGANQRKVAGPERDEATFMWPSWSPDGQSIACQVMLPPEDSSLGTHGGFLMEIWTVAVDGSRPTNVSESISDVLLYLPRPPAWSLDSQRLAFFSDSVTEEGDLHSTLYVVWADGSGLEQRIPLPWRAGSFAWSPTEEKMLLESLSETEGGIYVLSLQDQDLTQVYGEARASGWSPDGQEIIVSSDDTQEILILGADGEARPLVQFQGRFAANVGWSPDGKYIAVSTSNSSDLYKATAMHVVAVETGETTLVVDNDGSNEPIFWPNWSPDSSRLLYTTTINRSRPSGWPYALLWIYDVASGQVTQVTSGEGVDGFGSWSPAPQSSVATDEPAIPVFSKSNQRLGNTRSFGLAIADVDLDHDEDIFIANYIGSSRLWINNGNGTFTESSQTFDVSECHDVGIADFNGDGYPDIFLLGHASPSKVYFNDGSGTFTDSQQNIGIGTEYPGMIVLGDVDNDGDIDAFISHYEIPNRLWLNDGNGFFTKSDREFGDDGNPGHMELMDFNGDSFPDLFLCMTDAPDRVLLNDGRGNFTDTGQALGSSVGNENPKGKDIDGDGDNDIVVANNREGLVIWLNQDNTGTYVAAGDYFGDDISLSFELFDADLDGDFDLLTAQYDVGNVLRTNDGKGHFTSLGAVFGSVRVFSIGSKDIDGDGDIDIVFGQEEGTGGNEIYFNE